MALPACSVRTRHDRSSRLRVAAVTSQRSLGSTALPAMPAQCSADHWCWRDPKPVGNDYDHVYATSDDNIWLIGQHGTVLQWDGAAWRTHHPAVLPGQAAAQFPMSISGRNAGDMW